MNDSSFCFEREQNLNEWLTSHFGHEFFVPGKVETTFHERSLQFDHFKKAYQDSGIKIISIAGTNGKGETAHTLDYLLREQGYKTALWTSPHILTLRERFLINGNKISYEKILNYFGIANREAKGMSYYEFLFYCFHLFVLDNIQDLDYLILEVGLGGRLDSVNFFDADLTAVTSISRDHCEILGHDLVGILKEKLGITRQGVQLISNLASSYLQGELSKFCLDKSVPYIDLHQKGICHQNDDYSIQNRLLAYNMRNYLLSNEIEESREKCLKTLESLPLSLAKGRYEMMTYRGKDILFIGAHNLDGFKKMTQSLVKQTQLIPFDRVILSFSHRSEDDVLQCLQVIKKTPCIANWFFLSSFDHSKGLPLESIEKVYNHMKFGEKWSLVSDWKKLIDEVNEGGKVLVTGSYYFIGEVQKYFLANT